MLRALLDRFAIRPFERAFNYDASYMRDVLAASPASFLKFSVLSGLVQRRAAPAAALAAAGIVDHAARGLRPLHPDRRRHRAALQGACGRRCRAILAGDTAAMGETAALAWRFAHASLDRDMEVADPLRDEIVRRWGEKALVAISLAMVTGRLYPTLKYALGHGKTCQKDRGLRPGRAVRPAAGAGGMTGVDASADPFEAQRPRLIRLAYRMLGSMAEAEDVAQDAWLRWQGADRTAITDPAAWLVRVATRLCDRSPAGPTRRAAPPTAGRGCPSR